MRSRITFCITLGVLALGTITVSKNSPTSSSQFLGSAEDNSALMIQQGRQTFRFDTFGDEAFWGDQLQLHQAINGLTPRMALALGLKVDSQALSPSVVEAITSMEKSISTRPRSDPGVDQAERGSREPG